MAKVSSAGNNNDTLYVVFVELRRVCYMLLRKRLGGLGEAVVSKQLRRIAVRIRLRP